MAKNICALCKEEKDVLKKNTHYLTDSIIRNCLNLDGSGNNQEGLYFDISNTTPFMDFNFQRNTSVAKLEEALGRQATEEEIAKAIEIPFSVDDVFCKDCEDKFTNIESEFVAKILPRFREANLEGIQKITLPEAGLVRAFFYLQVFRSAICEPIFMPEENTIEDLRKIILSQTMDADKINHYPMQVTYLQTTGDPKEYTSNLVGFSDDRNPHVIFFNDFVVQFFDSEAATKFIDIFGLMTKEEFDSTVNVRNLKFDILIRTNDQRKKFIDHYNVKEKVDRSIEILRYKFTELWKRVFVFNPSERLWQEYFSGLVGGNTATILKYTLQEVVKYTQAFVVKKLSR